MKQLSIRMKITLWFSGALIVMMALTYFVVLSVGERIIQKGIRDMLVRTVQGNVDEIEYYAVLKAEDLNEVDYYVRYGEGYLEIDDDFLDEVNEIYTSLCHSDGTLVYGENPVMRETEEVGFLNAQIQRVTINGTLYYIFDRKLETAGLEELWLRGVVSELQGKEALASVSRISLVALPILLLIAVVGGYLIAARVLWPIRQIADTASQIRHGDDLKKRIDLGDGEDELHLLAREFDQMFSRLEEAFQTEQQFVSDASHELRTPVSVINAQCELTLEKEREPAEYEEALQVIWRQGRKLNRLIGTMLDFARLELQPERYEKETIDLTELTESLCTDMALIRENDISLTWNVEKGVYFDGSRELLTRLLSNLISNAYRYGRPEGHTEVCLKTEKSCVVLSVKDDGIGIAPEDTAKIFDRFYQADVSRTGSGNGLGLAMVKEIAGFYGGTVSVESELESGSIFTVQLPGF
ncbi:MAG: HAMP domain-containing histidine kinase [Clostridiales bacterium]|nr:HAMP domain-containing histidine kinase [Clostridiales bacterium]